MLTLVRTLVVSLVALGASPAAAQSADPTGHWEGTITAPMGQIDFDNPGQWGRLVSRSRNGRSETYELDFGRGNKVVTHVFWADPNNDAR